MTRIASGCGLKVLLIPRVRDEVNGTLFVALQVKFMVDGVEHSVMSRKNTKGRECKRNVAEPVMVVLVLFLLMNSNIRKTDS